MIDRQDLITLVVGFVAALPGLIALYLRYIHAGQRQEEREEARAQAELLRDLQEQLGTHQRTIRFLTRQVDELQAARAREYVETESLRQENEELRNEGRELREEVRELRHGVGELIRQMEEAKITPAWKPVAKPAAPVKRPAKGNDLVALRKKIVTAFSLREIGDLAFELDVDPDEVPGETATDRARALVTYLQDRGRLDELVALCREKRENGGF
jgi:seryl-tRNA synthetase